MTDGDALLKAILASPADDTARLVYADWLDENGNPGYAAYIRRGVALCHPERLSSSHDMGADWDGVINLIAQYPPPDPDHCPLCRAVADQRADPHTKALASAVGNVVGMPPDWSGRRDSASPPYVGVRCRGGFVYELRITADAWLAHADALLAAHPVTRVTLKTVPVVDSDGVHVRVRGRTRWYYLDGLPSTRSDPDNFYTALLKMEWPGVAFDLPDRVRLQPDGPGSYRFG